MVRINQKWFNEEHLVKQPRLCCCWCVERKLVYFVLIQLLRFCCSIYWKKGWCWLEGVRTQGIMVCYVWWWTGQGVHIDPIMGSLPNMTLWGILGRSEAGGCSVLLWTTFCWGILGPLMCTEYLNTVADQVPLTPHRNSEISLNGLKSWFGLQMFQSSVQSIIWTNQYSLWMFGLKGSTAISFVPDTTHDILSWLEVWV